MARLLRKNTEENVSETAPKTETAPDYEFERFWANVTFEKGNSIFSFFTTIPDLHKGDRIIVQTKRGLGIATFHAYSEPNRYANNWIIQKIDMTEYHRNLRLWESHK